MYGAIACVGPSGEGVFSVGASLLLESLLLHGAVFVPQQLMQVLIDSNDPGSDDK